MKIMFMGTPEIAATVLQALYDRGFAVTAVVTREDKPRGRGNLLAPTPVKALAVQHGSAVYTPKTLRDEAFAEILKAEDPDLILVVAFGKILPKNVLDYPRLGCINLHVSLLPKYRGAAPMQRAIMEGERETGVTAMYMDEGLDTGDIIETVVFPIGAEDDFEAIHDRSAAVGAKLICDLAERLAKGESLPRTKQPEEGACYAAKVEKEEAKIDFSLPAKKLDCLIRGTTPIPGAYAFLNGRMIKFRRAAPCEIAEGSFGDTPGACDPGRVLALDEKGDGAILIRCGEGALRLTSLIPEGKGKMSAGDFIRGRKIAIGDLFS